MAIPLVVWPIAIFLADRGLRNKIPKTLDKIIQREVTKALNTFESEWQAAIKRDTKLFTVLAAITLTCVSLKWAELLPNALEQIVVLVAYGVPLFFTLWLAWRVVQFAPRVFHLQAELTERIRAEFKNAGLGKRVLASLFESRTPEQLAEVSVGKAVFTFLEFAKQNGKTWLTLLGCYLLSYVALLTLRFLL
jgi:hypothetical protein